MSGIVILRVIVKSPAPDMRMLESAADLYEDEGEQVHAFDDDYTPEAVDVEERFSSPPQAHPELVDVPRSRREQHLPRDGSDKGREHEGNCEKDLHRLLKRHIRPGDEPREERSDDGAEHCDAYRYQYGHLERLEGLLLHYRIYDGLEVQLPVYDERGPEDEDDRKRDYNNEDEDGEKEDYLRHPELSAAVAGARHPLSLLPLFSRRISAGWRYGFRRGRPLRI